MSVTNRKMFRREARNKLRNMGGIMASSEPLIQEVAKFQFGGNINLLPLTVQTGKEPLANNPQVGNYKDALLRFFAEKVRPKGVPGMLKTDNTANVASSNNQGTTQSIDSRYVDDFINSDVTRMGKQIQETGGFGSLVTNTPGLSSSGQLTSGALGERKMGGAPSIVTGQGLEGMEDVFKNQALQAQKDAEAQKLLEAEQIAMREKEKQTAVESGMPMPGQVGTTDEKALQDQLSGGRISSETPQTLGVTADQGEKAKAEDLNKKFKNGEANLSDINNQVKNTVNTGVGVNGSMEQLMNEFTSNIKEYEGLDRGLAIAKIGFAMAAGESPNAITNIAKALEQGADMFIKDKAERDAFNRQVNLAAVQYGLGEMSKQRAEGRAIARERRKYEMMTFGANGGTYRGRKYGAYEDVPVMVGDIQDNNMPTGLVSTSMVKALGTKGKGFDALTRELVKQKVLSEDGARKDQGEYAGYVTKAITAERGQAVINKILLKVNEDGGITGVGAAVEDVYTKFKNTFGIEGVGKNISKIDEARTYMRQLLQDIVPVSLADVQSANSISNRDIDLLITAFFGDGALEPGSFQFVTQSTESITRRLQGAGARMAQSQTQAFSQMKSMEERLSTQFQRGSVNVAPSGEVTGISALNLLGEQRKRLENQGISLTEGGENITVGSNIGAFRDDQGVIQLKNPSYSS
tara:strand:+ start:528 stop:2603 length:2076 start_codon:yes stop_codon:yes gene_type:complete